MTSLYHVVHNICTVLGRSIKTLYFGLILILESRKDWCSIKQDRMQLFFKETLPAHCIVKVERLKTGEKLYERQFLSPRPPPKISLRHGHDWTRGKVQLGSAVDQQPEDKVVRQSRGGSSKRNVLPTNPTNPKTNLLSIKGNLKTCKMCLLLKVKRPVRMRSMKQVFTKNSVLQIDQGNLKSRLA